MIDFVNKVINGTVGVGLSDRIASALKHIARYISNLLIVCQLDEDVDKSMTTEEYAAQFKDVVKCWVGVSAKLFNQTIYDQLKYFHHVFAEVNALSERLYLFVETIQSIYGENFQDVHIELYIRAITKNHNELLSADSEVANYLEIKKKNCKMMSEALFILSQMFRSNTALQHECILTAFSLHPTPETFEKVRLAAVTRSVDTGQQEIEPPYFLRSSLVKAYNNKKTVLEALINFYNKLSTQSENYDPLAAPCEVLEANASEYGLTPQLVNDLVTVITGLRNKMLTWALNWPQLRYVCEMYLSKAGEIWNYEQTLNYLNVDYEMFKDRPPVNEVEEYGGIENGYEHIESDRFHGSESSSSLSQSRKRKKKQGRKRRKRIRVLQCSSESSENESHSVKAIRLKNANHNIKKLVNVSYDNLRRSERIRLNSLKSTTDCSDSDKNLPSTDLISSINSNKRPFSNTQDSADSDYEAKIRTKKICKGLCMNVSYSNLETRKADSVKSLHSKDQSSDSDDKIFKSVVRLKRINIKCASDDEYQRSNRKHHNKGTLSDSETLKPQNLVTLALDINRKNNRMSLSEPNSSDSDYETLSQSKRVQVYSSGSDIDSKKGNRKRICVNKENSSDLDKSLQPVGNVKVRSGTSDNESRRNNKIRISRKGHSSDSDYGTLRRSERILSKLSASDSESRADSLIDSDISGDKIRIHCCKRHSSDSDYGTCRRSERIKIRTNASDSESGMDSLQNKNIAVKVKNSLKKIERRSPKRPSKMYGRKKVEHKELQLTRRKRFINGNCVESDISNDKLFDCLDANKLNTIYWSPKIVLHDILTGTNDNSNLSCMGNCSKTNMSNFSSSLSCVLNLDNKKNACDLISDDVLSKTVPGLTSLDMIVPPPTESTVQVVQLPNNLNPTTLSLQNTRSSTSSQSSLNDSIQSDCLVAPKGNQQVSNDQCKQNSSPNTSSSLVNSSSEASQTRVSLNSSPPVHSSGVSVQSSNSVENSAYNQEDVSSQIAVSNSQPITYSHVEPVVKQQQCQQSTQRMKPKLTQVIRPAAAHLPTSTSIVECMTTNNNQLTIPSGNIHSSSHIQVNRQSLASTSQHMSPLLLSVQNINPIQTSKNAHLNRKATNSTTYKVAEENLNPVIDTTVTPVLKYIYKDGRLLPTQDKLTNVQNQKLDTSVTETQVSTDPKAVRLQCLRNSEQIVKAVNATVLSAKEKIIEDKKYSGQIASLPEFQQAFGKTMYQSNTGSIQMTGSSNSNSESGVSVGGNNTGRGSSNSNSNSSCNNGSSDKMSSSPEYAVTHADQTSCVSSISDTVSETSSSVTLPVMPVCTVLSKAVQTSSKEADVKMVNPSKSPSTVNQINKVENVAASTMTVASARSVQSTATNCQNSRSIINQTVKAPDRSGIIQSTTGVIFPCKVSGNLIQRKSVAILKPAVAKLELENRPKDPARRNNVAALLAAALQGSTPLRPVPTSTPGSPVHTKVSVVSPGTSTNLATKTIYESEKKKPEASVQTVLPATNVQRVALPSNMQKNIRRQPVLQPSKLNRPVVQTTSVNSPNLVNSPVVVNRNVTLITHSAIETSVSSKTLEQLREFESVLEQVTNTSQMKERSTVHTQSSLESINQQLILPQTSASDNSTEFTNTTDSPSPTVFQTTSTDSTVHDVHGRISLTYISQASTVSSSTLTTSNQKITSNTPVVVVQSCNRSVTSLSSTCQSSSNAGTSSNSTISMSKITMKTSKTTKSKSTNKSNPATATLKVSTLQKPQQKPQEDEQTTQRIYAILDKYAEQLRNSPELKNKPAPRRRSNPPTNPSPTSKRKKSTQTKSKVSSQQPCSSGMEMSPVGTVGSEDSSNGVTQISQVINSPQTRLDLSSGGDLSSEPPALCKRESLDSKDSQSEQKVVLKDASSSVQNRAVIVQDSIQSTVINVERTKIVRKQVVVGGTATMPLISLSNVPGTAVRQVLFPVSTDGRLVLSKVPKMYRVHQVTMPSGSPLLLQPMCVTKPGSNVKQVKPSVVSEISQNLTGVSAQPTVVLPSDGTFTLSSESGLEAGESVGINLDNTILLNTSSTQSILTSAKITEITEVHTNLGEETSALSFTSGSDIPVTCLKPDNVFLSSILPVISSSQEISSSSDYILTSTKPSSGVTSPIISQQQQHQEQFKEVQQHEIDSSSSSGSSSTSTSIHSRSSNSNNDGKGGENDGDMDTGKKKWFSANKSPQSDKELNGSTVKSLGLVHSQDAYVGSKTGIEVCSQKTKDVRKEQSSVVQETELDCDDSTSSGCVKRSLVLGKAHLLQEVSSDTDSPWRYTVTKIGSPKDQNETSILQRTSLQSNSQVILNQVQTTGFKRKSTENTIYQMAFHRSDKLRRICKDQDAIDHRNISLEGELRLQKSLSEECEDLGVDEPSTSDLFPEAELLLDPSSRDSNPELPAGMFNQSIESSSNSSRSPVLDEHSSEDSKDCLQETSSDDSCKDEELGSTWGEEPTLLSSEQMCPLHEETSNPVITTPFTYSNNRNSFSQDMNSFRLACRKRKRGFSYDKSWERTLKDYHPVNGLSDSDLSDKSTNKVNQTTLPSDSSPSPPVSTGGDTGGSAPEHDGSVAETSCIQSQLPGYTLSSRRSSLRGHIKKGCPCCNGSPERPKKKKYKDLTLKTENIIANFSSSSSKKTNKIIKKR
ncbi:uncharacterized protein LOC142323398 [Lycorma delicatula]|uniref:uncharacterized protein LOC142323398 n=1 Tax=Lycorma delicatula TaxID=130591 RepID=UPI003F515341